MVAESTISSSHQRLLCFTATHVALPLEHRLCATLDVTCTDVMRARGRIVVISDD